MAARVSLTHTLSHILKLDQSPLIPLSSIDCDRITTEEEEDNHNLKVISEEEVILNNPSKE